MPDGSAVQPARTFDERVSGDTSSRGKMEQLHAGEVVFLLGILIAWTALLAIGLFLSSRAYREALHKGRTPPAGFCLRVDHGCS